MFSYFTIGVVWRSHFAINSLVCPQQSVSIRICFFSTQLIGSLHGLRSFSIREHIITLNIHKLKKFCSFRCKISGWSCILINCRTVGTNLCNRWQNSGQRSSARNVWKSGDINRLVKSLWMSVNFSKKSWSSVDSR